MKKISLLLVVLLAAGSASLYGQMEIGTTFEVKGDAKATVGYNIDNEQFGFKNESSSSIKLELVPKTTIDNSDMVEMGGWYGYIELKEFKIVIDSGDEDSTEFLTSETMMDDDMTMDVDEAADAEKARTGLIVTKPGITAMLKNGPLFLKIFDAPEQKADLIAAIENDEDGDYEAKGDDQPNDVATDLSGAGVTLGFDNEDDLKVALGITSDEDWDGKYPDQPADHVDGTPDDSSFSISADLGVDVGPAQLQLQVVQGLAAAEDTDPEANDTGVAGKLTTTFGEVALNAGADLIMTGDANKAETAEDESLNFEVGLGADVTLTANTMFGAKYLYSSVQSVASDVEVMLEDKSGLVDRLSLGLTWGLFDINNGEAGGPATENDSMDMQVKGNLGYDLDAMGGTLTPSAELTLSQIDDENAIVGLTVAAVLKEAVPATEFGLQWKTAKLFDHTEDDAEQGAITAWAKITYG